MHSFSNNSGLSARSHKRFVLGFTEHFKNPKYIGL